MMKCFAVLASIVCALSSRAEIIINEIHYDPDVKTELVEFIELYNTGSAAVDLSNWNVTDAVDFTFPAGTSINANGYVVVSQNPTQFNAKFQNTALGPWAGSLNNEGDQIVLRDQTGLVIDRVDYQREFPWPVVGDPPGFSIELANPAFDNDLGGNWRPSGVGPTPGARNNSYTNNLPPTIRQVDHSPNQPSAGQPVIVSAKITDPEGVASVRLQYQIVDPGNYIELTDAAYATSWTTVAMNDAGTNGDQFPGDSTYSVTLPGSLQTHRRLIRYRITATDSTGKSITAPYADDACPNFAYFCYNGVPAWNGAIQPGSTNVARGTPLAYPSTVMNSLPVYHLISKKSSVDASNWIERYGGDLYPWSGTLVYDGKVFDHIHYRARGGVWRYAMGKNMWKFDFNRGHDFHPLDNWGRDYNVGWTKLNLGACIQQGDFGHRGEQGMFESVGFRLFNLAGVEAPQSHFIHFRVIDEAAETGANQFTGDFWGLYLAVEQEDSRFLEGHDMPDSNFYKMEGGFGTLNSEGPFGPGDGSDLSDFLGSIASTQPEAWWRDNFDVNRYYSYRTIVEGIHHYDIDGNPGKNYFYYTNDVTHKWEVHPWDLDLTWADNMYGSGNEQFKSRVLPIANLNREYKNRVREIRDLLFNTDQAYKLIDEYAAMIYTPGQASFAGADRAMWDYNPIMISQYVTSSKSGQGKFYQRATTKDFPGMVQIMKNYVVTRSAVLDSQAADTARPSMPAISNISPTGNPANRLTFQCSDYAGSSAFAAMQWRIGEITPADAPAFDPKKPRVYEIEPVWQSAELTTFFDRVTVPSGVAKVGHTYRARVKMKDVLGRWSNWSPPAEFIVGQADNATALVENLLISEIMYNPPLGSDYEYVELFNTSSNITLELAGVKFTSGIDFTFPSTAILPPRNYCLVARPASLSVFRTYYGLSPNVVIYGAYSGALNNAGEEITLKTSSAGQTIASFTYGNGAAWPIAADGAGHSLVPLFENVPQNADDFSYPGNWRASTYIKGSPGAVDSAPPVGLVINEVMSNTDYSDVNKPDLDSNDWIELANPTLNAIPLTGFFLSDDAAVLKKFALPPGSIAGGGLKVFTEASGMHYPITNGFGLDQAGEQVFLSYFPDSGPARVVDAVKFKGLPKTNSWARIPNATGFWRGAISSLGETNPRAVNGLVIREIMYHPATNANSTLDNTADEYVEIQNPTTSPVTLSATIGTWRISGGITYQFPSATTLAPADLLLLVNFSPTNTATADAFRTKFNIPAAVRLFGSYSGRLSNNSDRIGLERPEPPKATGEPISWIIVDEVTYGKRPLWPTQPDGSGTSLHRISATAAGNDPANWQSAPADPGRIVQTTDDRDGDGMPDVWESANGLNPDSAADAATDLDGDGISNLAEYQSGTDPRDPSSALRIAAAEMQAGQFSARVYLNAGKSYMLERCLDWNSPAWVGIRQFDATQTGFVDISDPTPTGTGTRFYRIRLVTH
jgi:hypothetical protein